MARLVCLFVMAILVVGCADESVSEPAQVSPSEPTAASIPDGIAATSTEQTSSQPAENQTVDDEAAARKFAEIRGIASPSGPALNGTDHLYWGEQGTIDVVACEDGAGSWRVEFDGNAAASGLLDEASAGRYTAVVSVEGPLLGFGQISVDLLCSDASSQKASVPLYVTPAARVIDTLGNPVEGATVRLLISETDGLAGPYALLDDQDPRMSLANRSNPDITTADGLFGWDTTDGIYRASVEKDGCKPPVSDGNLLSLPWKSPTFTIDGEIVLDCLPGDEYEPRIQIADTHRLFQTERSFSIPFTVSRASTLRLLECAYGEDIVIKDCSSPIEFTDLDDGSYAVSILAIDESGNSDFAIAVFVISPCSTLEPTIMGTDGDDVIKGTPGDDVIFGLGGDDLIDAAQGVDVICAGDGDDQINASQGDDYISGGPGDDRVDGGDGDDVCVEVETIIGCERPTKELQKD